MLPNESERTVWLLGKRGGHEDKRNGRLLGSTDGPAKTGAVGLDLSYSLYPPLLHGDCPAEFFLLSGQDLRWEAVLRVTDAICLSFPGQQGGSLAFSEPGRMEEESHPWKSACGSCDAQRIYSGEGPWVHTWPEPLSQFGMSVFLQDRDAQGV